MKLLLHKDRHVVVAEELSEDIETLEGTEELKVAWVTLGGEVEGTKRRGRRPDYDKPVPAGELKLLDHSEVSEEVLEMARKVISGGTDN